YNDIFIKLIETQNLWEQTEHMRKQAAANNPAATGDPNLFTAEELLGEYSTELPQKLQELRNSVAQLYDSWDEVLVEVEQPKKGTQGVKARIRIERKHVLNPASRATQSLTEHKWIELPASWYAANKNLVGQVIKHKPAGKYDQEASVIAMEP